MYNFKVGDKVRIVCKTKSNAPDGMGKDMGWENVWTDVMDNYIGKVVTISSGLTHRAGVRFKEVSYGWPLISLEPVAQDSSSPTKTTTILTLADALAEIERLKKYISDNEI